MKARITHVGRSCIFAIIAAVLSLFFVSGALAQAQPAPQPTAPTQQQDLQPLTPEQLRAIANGTATSLEVVRGLFRTIDQVLTSFVTGNPRLVALGQRIAIALYGVILIWGIMKSWILDQGLGQILPDFFQPTVILGLTFWAVSNLAPIVGSSVTGLASVFTTTIGPGARAPDEVDIVTSMAGAGFELIAAGPQGQGWGALVDKILSFVGRTFAAFALIAAGVVGAGTMMIGKVQVAIAILFAPVMIPWAMWRPTTFLFNAWLSFLIGGAMQTVMAAGIGAMTLPVINQLAALASTAKAGTAASYTMMVAIILLCLLILFLFSRTTSMANALVGSASIGIEGWASQAKALATGAIGLTKLAVGAASIPAKAGLQFGQGLKDGYTGASAGSGGAGKSGGANKRPSLSQALGQLGGKGLASASKTKSEYPKAPPAPKPSAHKPFRPNPDRKPVRRPIREAA